MITKTINIYELINSNFAGTTEEGNLLYNQIIKGLKFDIKIILNFTNIDYITTSFLDTAIGQLYKFYQSSFLKEHIKIINIRIGDLYLIKEIIKNAKQHFKNDKTRNNR